MMNSVYLCIFIFIFSKQVQKSEQTKIKISNTCYEISPFGPRWDSEDPMFLNTKPITPEKRQRRRGDINFLLYTKSRPREFTFGFDVEVIKTSGWNSENDVKILIHGYSADGYSDMPQRVKDAYIRSSFDYNIICVDWGRLAGGDYGNAVSHTANVGSKIGNFIEFLKNNNFIKCYDSVHLIGHSLGAHAAGFAGDYLKGKGQTLGRITGLDPAGPNFSERGLRLDASDAKFVDAVHTSARTSGFALGTSLISGHIDFYPNGGSSQPDCGGSLGELLGTCSHTKAVEYFASSIGDKNLYNSCPCESWPSFLKLRCSPCTKQVQMGEHCDTSARGQYYLHTR